MPAPDDLENLGHGRGYLRHGPAMSVRRLDVLLGRPLDINSAYRDWDEQMRAYNRWLAYKNGTGPVAPRALHPNDSWHCKGLAIDTDDRLGTALWKEHGWLFEVRDEPWHGQYYTSLDKHYGELSGGNGVPLPTTPRPLDLLKGNEMSFVVRATSNSSDGVVLTGRHFSVSTVGPITLMSADEVAALEFFTGPTAATKIPYRLHQWDGNRIRNLMSTRGYFPWSASTGKTDYSQVKY